MKGNYGNKITTIYERADTYHILHLKYALDIR